LLTVITRQVLKRNQYVIHQNTLVICAVISIVNNRISSTGFNGLGSEGIGVKLFAFEGKKDAAFTDLAGIGTNYRAFEI
jgi:hypothetical protein